MDDRKPSGEEHIAEHTSRHDTIIRKLLEKHVTTSTALKIRHLVEAMDEEEISFHEQTTQRIWKSRPAWMALNVRKETTTTPHYVRTR
jgi:ribosome biogenesis SPOUT family RNA methylase Rps3